MLSNSNPQQMQVYRTFDCVFPQAALVVQSDE